MRNIAIIACMFILFDIVCGVASAAKNKELSSSVMREGLYHKFAELLLIALAILCDFLLTIEPFNAIGIPAQVSYAIAIYIVAMEILSIIENICKMNPELPLAKILYYFNIAVDSSTPSDVDSESAPEK